ncbi:MAG: ATP-binding protein, partial [Myxococcota bacterium]
MKLDFEKLGAFYLGRRFEPDTGVTDETILYDAKDLTTHAMCVGMTGSGKTGLCLSLLEEAAIDGIPAICIDPKGDLGNLLLTFPSLEASAFEPWIDPGDASRRGQTAAERAVDVAALWKDGLASWGQDGARIQRLRDAVDFAIYTPGSDAGRQISVMGSLKPPKNYDGDTDRITAAVSGLLSMIGVDADPVQSREHVFLSNVVHHAWSRGEALELGGLVRAVMDPPIARVGVLDLDTFFPKKDRQALAMRLNGLLASPGFGAWMQGEPLSAQRLLWTPEGKPRVSILNIAHLSDEERMFFVTLLLNEVVSWMRTQPGTSSLRALLYMDEVFGFLPPVAAPPSKKLFLTLLKQARAYGLGLVLATQNPIDLDYKALSNCGTWLLGRLQTERDVARVMDGLAGAAQAAGQTFDASALKSTLAGLKSRVFLMNNVHESAPVLFHTRWAMSYLRGPLTSAQIRTLEGDAGDDGAKGATAGPTATAATASATVAAATAAAATAAAATSTGATSTGATSTGGATASADPIQARPVIEAEIDEFFVGDPVGDFSYEPAFLATVRLHYKRA